MRISLTRSTGNASAVPDRLVTVVELRIKECLREEPPEEWDGSVGLDKL